MDQAQAIFDRGQIAGRLARARREARDVSPLWAEIADTLAERLQDIARPLPRILEIAGPDDGLRRAIAGPKQVRRHVRLGLGAIGAAPDVIGDEEWLPFGGGRFDAVISPFGLHRVNDLPGALIQMRMALKPDGLLLACLPGESTLAELRECLTEAEAELTGGVSPRVAPMVDIRSIGSLMQRAGFALPVIDRERTTLSYANPFDLIRDLRAAGETNIMTARSRRIPPRLLFPRTFQIYAERYGETGEDGRIHLPVSLELIHLSGWVPDASQQKPLRPGSAIFSLEEALSTAPPEPD